MFFMTLLGLALLDSLSTGTLVIPLIFLAQSQLRARILILYCFTLGLFYVVLGFLLLLGVETITWTHHPVFSSQERYWIQLVLGVLLFAYGILSPDPNSRASETNGALASKRSPIRARQSSSHFLPGSSKPQQCFLTLLPLV